MIAAGAALVALAGFAFDHLDRIPYFSGPLYTLKQPVGPPQGGLGVIMLSGDMGLRAGLSGQVAERMGRAGYPVLGVNSLVFAADGRTPAEIGTLVAGAMHRLLAMPGVRRVVLIGHSFGADLLHVGLVHLSPADRAHVALVILEVPTDSIYLDAGIREYFEIGRPDVPALASATQLDWVPVTCIRGAAETTSLCPLLAARHMPNVRQVVLPGGHKLNRDAAALFAASLAAIRRDAG